MVLEEYYYVSQIASAAIVIASVIYLAIQVRGNAKALRSQAHYNALFTAQRPFEMMIETEGLAKLINTFYMTPAELDDGERERCTLFVFMQYNSWEYLYYQNSDGSIPREFWVGADAWFRHLIRTKPGFRRVWSELSESFGEPFRSYVVHAIEKRDLQ